MIFVCDLMMAIRLKLGPRIIPYFREIVAECVAILRENLEGALYFLHAIRSSALTPYLEPSPIVDGSVKVIHSLLTSIPAFWGTGELGHLIQLYVDQCAVTASAHTMAMTGLAKALSKQVPMKAVLPVMCDMWPPLYQSVCLSFH
jgi:U3 small nucleolar RNA-associated protein 10